MRLAEFRSCEGRRMPAATNGSTHAYHRAVWPPMRLMMEMVAGAACDNGTKAEQSIYFQPTSPWWLAVLDKPVPAAAVPQRKAGPRRPARLFDCPGRSDH
jgi:hypothetical protein